MTHFAQQFISEIVQFRMVTCEERGVRFLRMLRLWRFARIVLDFGRGSGRGNVNPRLLGMSSSDAEATLRIYTCGRPKRVHYKRFYITRVS